MLRFVVLLAALLTLIPGTAAAQSCKAPPGTAAIDEYCETVPSAKGDRGTADPSETVPISKQTAQALARSSEGSALLRQLGHDAQKPSGNKKSSASKGKAGASAPAAPSNNPLDAVGAAVSSGPTLGGGFIIALLVVTLLMAGWGWV